MLISQPSIPTHLLSTITPIAVDIYHRKIQRLDSDGKFKRNDSCAVAFWTFLLNCPCVALSDPISNDQLDLRAFLNSYLKMKVLYMVNIFFHFII